MCLFPLLVFIVTPFLHYIEDINLMFSCYYTYIMLGCLFLYNYFLEFVSIEVIISWLIIFHLYY